MDWSGAMRNQTESRKILIGARRASPKTMAVLLGVGGDAANGLSDAFEEPVAKTGVPLVEPRAGFADVAP